MTIAKILLTLTALFYSLLPPLVDLNLSHALHPDWVPHARLHLVWLVTTNSLAGLLAIWLIWRHPGGALIGGAISACVLGGYLIAAAFMPVYGGALSDVVGSGTAIDILVPGTMFFLNAVGLWLQRLDNIKQ